METGLLHNYYFGNFSTRGERYYFTRGEIEPMRGEIETNIGNSETRKNSNFLLGWKGPLVMIFDRVEVGGGGGWQGFQMGGSEEPDQVVGGS